MGKNNFDISFNNPLYRERLTADKYFDNPYLKIIDEMFIRTPVTEKGGTLALYAMEDKQESSKLANFGADPKQLKDKLSKCSYTLNAYSLERPFGDIEYRDEEVIKSAEKLVMQNIAEVVYRDYLLDGMNELHTKAVPVEIKQADDFIGKLKEVKTKMHLSPNKIAMSAKTANEIIGTDKGILKRIEAYKIPEFDNEAALQIILGIKPFIFELPEDTTYDGYIYLLNYTSSGDIYSKSVGLRNFVYNGSQSGGYERANFHLGQFARRYYSERGGVNGRHYAQFSLIGQLKVDNPNLISVLKLTNAKSLPKNYPSA
ncbi:hypothetical protein F0310_04525 (plasmid) [Borrelia sp. A-FGy1]|uniref:hypothetical protein n=1 Tax=Borrelia sp. A-FGy1 TaxID=2608247 RepID=UPI0015F3D4CB|nr:hypothetical protein [Borrelia sp. A-FGy1]QMU99683.1 hypothetical protein F0310_04525 [Borrelia sp. A-FGy1]